MGRRRTLKAVIYVCMVIIIICIFCIARQNESPSVVFIPDDDATTWAGPKDIQKNAEEQMIAIPGITEMIFQAGQLVQNVNIYNPEVNECYMQFSLYCDDIKIWESGYCKPGNGYYEIEITNPVGIGKHKGNLIYKCFTYDGAELNSARMSFDIMVEGE